MLDLIEQKREDHERLTVAVAQGYGISMSAEYAAQWSRDHGGSQPAIPPQHLGQMIAKFPRAFRVTRTN